MSEPLASLAAVNRAAKYTPAQREAMAAAFDQLGHTGKEVVELAAAGALTHPNGATLGPFTATESAVRSEAGRARYRREREAARTRLSELPWRDAVELLRCRLGDMLEREMDRIEIERAQNPDRPIDAEHLRQLGRAVREFQCIPGPDDPRPPAPGAKRNGVRQGGETRGGLAGPLLRASEQSARPHIPVADGHDHSRNGN
jgi:hypothetical protein